MSASGRCGRFISPSGCLFVRRLKPTSTLGREEDRRGAWPRSLCTRLSISRTSRSRCHMFLSIASALLWTSGSRSPRTSWWQGAGLALTSARSACRCVAGKPAFRGWPRALLPSRCSQQCPCRGRFATTWLNAEAEPLFGEDVDHNGAWLPSFVDEEEVEARALH